MLEELRLPEKWEEYYAYKTSLACPKDIAGRLRAFIDAKGYLEVCDRIDRGEPFALPFRSVVSKQSSQKKRVVYTYPYAENMVLKLLTYLLLRKFDPIFDEGLFSFRPGRSAQDAIRFLTRLPGIYEKYTYKVDISNYFNSVKVPRLLPMLRQTLSEDPKLADFLCALLEEPRVIAGREEITEQKGIMAGTPLASFYANLYLRDLDESFAERGILYARYSDDIVVFADSQEELQSYAADVRTGLAAHGLEINRDKESFSTPEEGFTFLGFSMCKGTVDIAPGSIRKLKQKMRRKTRALQRWAGRGEIGGERAAKAFCRIFNRKLLENSHDSDLTWSYWYFPVINTTAGLHEIDHYAQDCMRVLVSGRHNKARFNTRYEDLKRLGYRSLVHAYYSCEETTERKDKDEDQ